MKFTTERPKTQQIIVKGQSDQQPVEFVGVYNTFSKEELADLKARIASIEGLADVDETYDEIADLIFVGWTNPPGRQDLWVTDPDNNEPLECTEERKRQLMEWPSVNFAIVMSFYKAMFSETLSLGNLQASPGNGFRKRVGAASKPTT